MIEKTFYLIIFIQILVCRAECPNACNNNGICTIRDYCKCYKNWMGNDCSLRICPFGKAHVDTPLGDLDMSQSITGYPILTYNQMYPYGIYEQFPIYEDEVNNNGFLSNTAHAYMECSNKGNCNRNTGECDCMNGYTGSSCQRNLCPSIANQICNGHGICISAREAARLDNRNLYNLWDSDILYGCICDNGYYGSHCNYRICKYGYDPMYFETKNNRIYGTSRRYSNWTIIVATDVNTIIIGNYSLIFYDYTGQKWTTELIPYNASCQTVTNALEKLPNNVIRQNTTLCLKWNNFISNDTQNGNNMGFMSSSSNIYSGIKYILSFPKNPGKLKQIEISTYVQNKYPTLYTTTQQSTSPSNRIQSFIYPNGYSGENEEYFTQYCHQVDVTIGNGGSYYYIDDLKGLETRLFARCLGKVDNDYSSYSAESRVQGQTFKWDYGDIYHPHLIRLVDKTKYPLTDLCLGYMNNIRDDDDPNTNNNNSNNNNSTGTCTSTYEYAPGFIVPIYYDPSTNLFKILTRPGIDYYMNSNTLTNTLFSIFTTDGYTQMVNEEVKVYTLPEKPYSKTIYTTNSSNNYINFIGNVDCETTTSNINGANDCIEKNKMIFILDPYDVSHNPIYMNIYTVTNIRTLTHLNYHGTMTHRNRITLDYSINAAWDRYDNTTQARLYIFYPNSSFTYVSECSNRGICDSDSGLCTCFNGYNNDDCSIIDNSLTLNYTSSNLTADFYLGGVV